MVQNKALIFKKVPETYPKVGEHLTIETRQFDTEQSAPKGGITTKNHYISFDPYQRGRMRDASIKSYSPPFTLNEPITNAGIRTVLKSDNDKFKAGDVIFAMGNTEEYSVFEKEALDGARVIQNPYNIDVKNYVGALGMPGLTAYSSFYAIGEPKKGETIFISAASGAVGQLVGQLAKHEGLTVIGSVGDDKKKDYVINELKFDAAFNYKTEKPADALKRLAPNGIDIYYENVGGEQLEAALDAINKFGRIVACGMISQYNAAPEERYPIRNLMNVIAKSLKMEGFIVFNDNMGPKYFDEHQKNVQKWIHEGTYKPQLSVTEGIDNAGEGLLGLFEGKNFGKAVLEISKL